MEGWDVDPTLGQGSACQTGLNRALGFGRGTLEMPLAIGPPGGLSFQKEPHRPQLHPE